MPTGNRLTFTRAVLGAVVLIGEERGGVDMLITLITKAGSLHDRGTSANMGRRRANRGACLRAKRMNASPAQRGSHVACPAI